MLRNAVGCALGLESRAYRKVRAARLGRVELARTDKSVNGKLEG